MNIFSALISTLFAFRRGISQRQDLIVIQQRRRAVVALVQVITRVRGLGGWGKGGDASASPGGKGPLLGGGQGCGVGVAEAGCTADGVGLDGFEADNNGETVVGHAEAVRALDRSGCGVAVGEDDEELNVLPPRRRPVTALHGLLRLALRVQRQGELLPMGRAALLEELTVAEQLGLVVGLPPAGRPARCEGPVARHELGRALCRGKVLRRVLVDETGIDHVRGRIRPHLCLVRPLDHRRAPAVVTQVVQLNALGTVLAERLTVEPDQHHALVPEAQHRAHLSARQLRLDRFLELRELQAVGNVPHGRHCQLALRLVATTPLLLLVVLLRLLLVLVVVLLLHVLLLLHQHHLLHHH
eukprot:Hpha_TRINITY_DN15035_c4_g9::TRINITY_DN15035_c4_g9_i1::g.123118::m.123118